MNIWLATMECAGIAEAGGVKDVSYSLAKGFCKAGCEVTLFIPVFGCTSFKKIRNLNHNAVTDVKIPIGEQSETVSYSVGFLENSSVTVVFINHPSFEEKLGVYVYTEAEEKVNSKHKRGNGHDDGLFLDALFSKAVCAYGKYVSAEKLPDIVHCQDASTAVLPCYASYKYKEYFSSSKFVVTIHNAGPAYHHDFMNLDQASYYTGFPYSILNQAQNGYRVEPFLLASLCAKLTTVSTYYAEELCDPENGEATDGLSVLFSQKNISVEGITNGIDYKIYRPERRSVSLLPYPYCPRKNIFFGKWLNQQYFLKLCRKDCKVNLSKNKYMQDIIRYGFIDEEITEREPVYFMYHGRIAWQKGISLLLDAIPFILKKYPEARFFIVGQGDPKIESDIKDIVSKHEGKIVFMNGYNAPVSRLVAAASDFAVLPSFFEPCCLEDFIAQVYGTFPIAHGTGGLKKILDEQTGFLFMHNNVESLIRSVDRAMALFADKKTMKARLVSTANYIFNEYSWENVIQKKYLKFFKNL